MNTGILAAAAVLAAGTCGKSDIAWEINARCDCTRADGGRSSYTNYQRFVCQDDKPGCAPFDCGPVLAGKDCLDPAPAARCEPYQNPDGCGD